MAIYRNGVRVKRPASSFSSDEVDAAEKGFSTVWNAEYHRPDERSIGMGLYCAPAYKKRKVLSASRDDNKDAETELCQVGDNLCSLPKELFDLDDLGSVLSMDVWNHCLSEKDRESLCAYLPDMDEDSFKQTLKELFSGCVFNFSSPMVNLLRQLKDGMCYPTIVQYREALRLLERKEHYHHLRSYHDGMIDACIEMKNLWLNHGDVGINEQLKVWHRARSAVCDAYEIPSTEIGVQKAVNLNLVKGIKVGRAKSSGMHGNDVALREISGERPVQEFEHFWDSRSVHMPSTTHVDHDYGFKKLTSMEASEFCRAFKLGTWKRNINEAYQMQASPPVSHLPSDDMRARFRKEETARYASPGMCFFYTNATGEKSAVAPLKRIGGKLNSKARDHPLLKLHRPAHVTILSIVRDAAARLPHNTGTRADICSLVRDSQYLVADVSDSQLSQVVSGALDRLHYEKDPCVRYNAEKKLWMYMHADRDETSFKDNGTISTKGCKGHKKDASSHPFRGFRGPTNKSFDYQSSSFDNGLCEDDDWQRSNSSNSVESHSGDECALPFIDLPPSMQPACANIRSHPMGWEVYLSRW